MKVKNLMFSGFAAAMFAGVIGGADAATYNLASKDYVDTKITGVDARLQGVDTAIEKKQDKLTAGTGVTIDTVDGVTTINTAPVKIGEENVPVADAITNVTNEITNITNVLGEIPEDSTVQAELGKKEDVANKVSDNLTADELNGMSAEEKSNKYPSIGAAMAIATAMVGEISDDVADLTNLKSQVEGLESVVGDETAGLVKDVDDLQSADATMGNRVDTLESALNDETNGLVKKVTALETADETMGGRVETLETNVGNTPVETQINNKIDALKLADTYETKEAVTEAKYVSAKNATAQGGYLVKVDAQGNTSMVEVAIVNGDGTTDMITGSALPTE